MGKCREMRQALLDRQAQQVAQFRQEHGFAAELEALGAEIARIQANCPHNDWETNWTVGEDDTEGKTRMSTDEYHSEPRMPKITRTCQECDLVEETTVDRICPKCGHEHHFVGQCDNPTEFGRSGFPKIDFDQIPERYREWRQGPDLAHYLQLYHCDHCSYTLVIVDANIYLK